MGQWEIALLIFSILGGVWGIISGTAKVIKPLIEQMTKLNENVIQLNTELETNSTRNNEAHEKIIQHQKDQDIMLNNHEVRLAVIERSNKHD